MLRAVLIESSDAVLEIRESQEDATKLEVWLPADDGVTATQVFISAEQERDLYALFHRRIREREDEMRKTEALVSRADMRLFVEHLMRFPDTALSDWTSWRSVAHRILQVLEAPSAEPRQPDQAYGPRPEPGDCVPLPAARYGRSEPCEYLAEMGCTSDAIRARTTTHNHAPELPFATYERIRTAKDCEIVERFEVHAKNGATAGQQMIALLKAQRLIDIAEDSLAQRSAQPPENFRETSGDTCDACGQRHYPDDEECNGQDDAEVDAFKAAYEDLTRRNAIWSDAELLAAYTAETGDEIDRAAADFKAELVADLRAALKGDYTRMSSWARFSELAKTIDVPEAFMHRIRKRLSEVAESTPE